MGRYRSPASPKSPYITIHGFRRLEQEQTRLWLRRREVTKALTAAAAEGDRSENAEYIYRKKELREIDNRIRYLQKRIPILKVIGDMPGNKHQVFFAARVTLEDETEEEYCYRIVGPDELDCDKYNISMDSPLAKALMKRQIGDTIEVETPRGRVNYHITGIEYLDD